MKLSLSAILLVTAFGAEPALAQTCAKEIRATSVASNLTDLPQEIREHLDDFDPKGMGERDAPLLKTDAPVGVERGHRQTRFVQAFLVKDEWFVQFEVAMFSGVRTIGYVRDSEGRFRPWPPHYFGGPPCESINAALQGVTTPGGFNF